MLQLVDSNLASGLPTQSSTSGTMSMVMSAQNFLTSRSNFLEQRITSALARTFRGMFRLLHLPWCALTSMSIASLEVIQEGTVRIHPVRKFEDAALHPVMLKNVELAGYAVPTPIQQYCLPAVAKGYDIVACAQTGSGKTAVSNG